MYLVLYIIIAFFVVPYLKLKALIKKQDFSLKERFVFYKDFKEKTVWIHCASVGELNTVRPIYSYLNEKYSIVLTVSSPRGKKYAKQLYKDAVVRELPLDIPFFIKKFIKMYNPKGLIIVEGEFWFNIIKTSSRFMPVVSINTRISPKSFEFYRKISFLFKKVLKYFTLIITRSNLDAKYISHFTDKSKIVVCGDLKLVSSTIKKEVKLSLPEGKKVIVAGSTYETEETVLFDIIKDFPDTLFIVAPRHLDRLDKIVDEINRRKLKYSLLSQYKSDDDVQIILVDKLGVLPSLYKYADVAFIGGTLENIGGHNILEALVENKPVIIGNHYFKIKPLVEEFKDFVYIVSNKNELKIALKQVINSNPINLDINDKIRDVLRCYISNLEKVLNESRN